MAQIGKEVNAGSDINNIQSIIVCLVLSRKSGTKSIISGHNVMSDQIT